MYIKTFENYEEPTFRQIDGNERHEYVKEKGYQDFDTSDISYLKKEFWDDSKYNITKEGPRAFRFWCIISSVGDYEFIVYKLTDEYFIVDTVFLPYGRNTKRKFLNHTLCDQIDGLVKYIDRIVENI